ncbi:hypothetical protein LTR56_018868 [Elasticomyces elasticus]|nr:hypothetical protein LTR56_018868 [Elasticomyces elasticus]KAK3638011.1 hypothetical protein LTR22_017973 [Elasticomyces elasticus]KAK4912951.1 hypothetical protein LTR49_018701 [Elasticomyces elasticus]KAK5749849.1 hypothetical protein LTS12_020067 [Elasticomyces elasticus]
MAPTARPSLNGVQWDNIKQAEICEALGIDETEYTQATAAILPAVNINAIRLNDQAKALELANAIQHLDTSFNGRIATQPQAGVTTATMRMIRNLRNYRKRHVSSAPAASSYGGPTTTYLASTVPPTTLVPPTNATISREDFKMPSLEKTFLEAAFTPSADLGGEGRSVDQGFRRLKAVMSRGGERWEGENIDASNINFAKCMTNFAKMCHKSSVPEDFKLFWTHPIEGEQICFDQQSFEAAILTLQATISDSNNVISFILRSKDDVPPEVGHEATPPPASQTSDEKKRAEAKVREAAAVKEKAEQVKRKARDEEAKKKRREVERKEREALNEQEAEEVARRKLEEDKKNKKKNGGAGKAKVRSSTVEGSGMIDLTEDEHQDEAQPQNARRRMPILTIFNPSTIAELRKEKPWTRDLEDGVVEEIMERFQERAMWMKERRYMWRAEPTEKDYIRLTMGSRSASARPDIINAVYEQIDSLCKGVQAATLEDDDDEVDHTVGAELVKQHLATLERTGEDSCEEAREFWKMDKEVWNMHDAGRTFVGMRDNIVLRNYQLLAVYILLKWGHGIQKGGFLSDDMGLGKTIQGLGAFFVQLLITDNVDEVRVDAGTMVTRHLPQGGQADDARCPVEESDVWEYPFPCICREHAITRRRMNANRGAGLVVAPNSITTSWYNEAKSKFDLEVLDAYVYMAVNSKGPWSTASTKHARQMTVADAKFIQLGQTTPERRKGLHPYAHRRLFITAFSSFGAKIRNEKNVGMGTKPEMTHRFGHPDPLNPTLRKKGWYPTGYIIDDKHLDIRFGFMVYDELHKNAGIQTGLMKELPNCLHDQSISIFLSGTIIDNDLHVPVGALRILQRHYSNATNYPMDFDLVRQVAASALTRVPKLAQFFWTVVSANATVLGKLTVLRRDKKEVTDKTFLAEVKRAQDGIRDMLVSYVLRRTGATPWLDDMPAVLMPANLHYDVKLPLTMPGSDYMSSASNNTAEMRARRIQGLMDSCNSQQAAKRKRDKRIAEGKKSKDTREIANDPLEDFNPKSSNLARIASSFPALLDFFGVRDPSTPDIPMGATEREPKDWNMKLVDAVIDSETAMKADDQQPQHPWLNLIPRWAEDSPKTMWAEGYMEGIDRIAGGDGEKWLIFCHHIGTATILYNYLRYEQGWKGVCLVHSRVPDEQRSILVEAFQGNPPGPGDTKLKRPLTNDCRIIITTFALMGVGFNCTAAYRTILFEPGQTPKEEKQAASRTNRTNQPEPTTYSHRCYCPDSAAENYLVNHNAARTVLSSELVGK